MSITFKSVPIFSPASLSSEAEISLITPLLDDPNLSDIPVQRRLSLYPWVSEDEKNLIIMDLMEYFWKLPNTKEFFRVFRDFDTVFSILDKKGHYVHQFEVFLLGLFFILRIMKLDPLNRLTSNNGDSENIFFCWLIASTAHDIGYPLQIAKKLAVKFYHLYDQIHLKELSERYKKLSENYNVDSEKELHKIIVHANNKKVRSELNIEDFVFMGIYSSIGDQDQAKKIHNSLKEKNNHGYVSACILCRNYIEFLSGAGYWGKTSEEWRKAQLMRSAAAIALHAIPYSKQEYIKLLSFDANPVAYLLYLIDNLQEWNRYLRITENWPSYNLLNFSSTENTIKLSYVLTHEDWNNDMKNRIIESLKEKSNMLMLPKKPDPPINLRLLVDFSSNVGHKFKGISLKI